MSHAQTVDAPSVSAQTVNALSGERVPRGRCPVCHVQGSSQLFEVTAHEAAQHFVTRAKDAARHQQLAAHIATLWGTDSCSVRCCASCEFCFADPYVGGDARFYQLAYQGNAYPSEKWEFKRTRELLAGLIGSELPDEPTMLEIGAGHGLFVKMVSPSLIRAQDVVCLEYSLEGIRRIRDAGIAAQAVDVREFVADRTFDVVCAFQVLEHLDRLDELFARLGDLTGPAAHLFLSVPNPQRIAFNEGHGALLDMPPNHIGRWNRKAIDTIGTRHGWQVQAFEREPNVLGRFLKQFAGERYLRSRQLGGALHRMADQMPWRPLERALQAPLVGWQLVRTLAMGGALMRDDLGDALFMHLKKVSPAASRP